MARDIAATVDFCATVRLGKNGQFTIPKVYRQSLALDAGAPIAAVQVGNALLLIPEQARFRELCERVARSFSTHGVEAADALATLPEAREIVYARLYPDLIEPRKRRKVNAPKPKRG